MRAGPLRSLIAGFGLVAILPIAWMVVQGDLSAAEAGTRAAIVFGVVLVVGRIADMMLSVAARSFERRAMAAARARRSEPKVSSRS